MEVREEEEDQEARVEEEEEGWEKVRNKITEEFLDMEEAQMEITEEEEVEEEEEVAKRKI